MDGFKTLQIFFFLDEKNAANITPCSFLGTGTGAWCTECKLSWPLGLASCLSRWGSPFLDEKREKKRKEKEILCCCHRRLCFFLFFFLFSSGPLISYLCRDPKSNTHRPPPQWQTCTQIHNSSGSTSPPYSQSWCPPTSSSSSTTSNTKTDGTTPKTTSTTSTYATRCTPSRTGGVCSRERTSKFSSSPALSKCCPSDQVWGVGCTGSR